MLRKGNKMANGNQIPGSERISTELKRTAEELKKERMFLDVLCRDCISVYYLDLNNDTMEVLKLNGAANAARIIGTQTRQIAAYSDTLQDYCAHYVIDAEKNDFLKAMSCEHLIEKLKENERYVYRYQSVPNQNGHCHFDAQVLRVMQDEFDGTAILAFRRVDEVVTAERN